MHLSQYLLIRQRILKLRIQKLRLLLQEKARLAGKRGEAPVGGRVDLEELAEESWKTYFRFTRLEIN